MHQSPALLLTLLFACGESAQTPEAVPPAQPIPILDVGELEWATSMRSVEEQFTGGIGGVTGGAGMGTRGVGLGGGGGAYGTRVLGTRGYGKGSSGMGASEGTFSSYSSYGSGTYVPPVPAASRRAEGTEQYTNPGVNPQVLTQTDTLSTFSIDVDTASFAIMRSHIDRNRLPPIDAVRVEEFINAQHYTYRPPTNDAPFAVNMEASPDPIAAHHHLLRVGVKAAVPDGERLPVHLTFLVDTSCSMASSDKLPLAKQALHHLVDNLGPEDRVALATYAGDTRVVLEPTRVSHPKRIHAAIEKLSRGGGTRMQDGMHLAYDLALAHRAPGTENRVIVLSDGDANIGATSHEAILKSLKGYAKQGITLSTIGFGRGNYRDTLMEQLANDGDGNYHYIDTLDEAKKVFGRDITSTLQTVARDVKIQVEFNPKAVISYRLIGYENRAIADKDFRNDAVDAGEIGSGHAVTALYDLVLRDDPAETLATVRMRSKPPGPDAPAIERQTRLPTSAIRMEFASATRDFRIAWTAATFAELLRGSPHVQELTYSELAHMGGQARRNTDDDSLIDLIRRAGRLAGETEVASR